MANRKAVSAGADPQPRDGPPTATEPAASATEIGAGGDVAGAEIIRGHLRTLPGSPGVYQMFDIADDVLYVGKAKNLKNRVSSYVRGAGLTTRIQKMVQATRRLEVVTTHTEVEALLLEANLIKRHRPPFNVLLRDDKSFPYILLTADDPWPRLTKYRGTRSGKGDFFGPFASAGSVNRTLASLERAFLLRSCSDAVFTNRTRPCLLYQIKRCSGPCVDKIRPADYATLVRQARAFLGGGSQQIQQSFARRMNEASEALEYESAASFRDRIRALTQIQAHQDINPAGITDADVIAGHQAGGQTCIQVFFFRSGRNNGNRAYFPRHHRTIPIVDVIGAFIGQFYDDKSAPPLVLTSHEVAEQDLIAEALSLRAGRRVRLLTPQRGDKRRLVGHARSNAEAALGRRMAESASQRKLLDGVATMFSLDAPPQRIEVYDNSHISGQNPVGAMIVAGPDGLIKNAYRKFNIRGVPSADDRAEMSPGDDYAMMREVLTRRFSRALKEDPERAGESWPDLVLIDGGLGQLNVASEVFADLGIDDVAVAGISKGPDRNAGRERFHLPDRPPFSLEPNDPVLYFLQRLRDEAHRFAIGTHRAQRGKTMRQSNLDQIAGIGRTRKRALLVHFGSARDVARAGLDDLEQVEGISRTVAKKIYDHFHSGD